MAMEDFVKKFWLKEKLEAVEIQAELPRTNLLNYTYYTGNNTRIKTVEIYTNEGGTLDKIITDDGEGNLQANASGILSTATGDDSIVAYTTNKITIYWNAAYLASLTADLVMRFKYISDDNEHHVEMVEFIGEALDYYKTNELDDRTKYYDPENIPSNQIDNLATDHNWIMDRAFSESSAYLRRQLKFLYNLYKAKRKIKSINFAISVINKRVNFYNLVAKKNEYNDLDKYEIFDTETLLTQLTGADPGTDQEAIASQIQAVYDSLYDASSNYFPSKHFLLDLALDILNDNSNLLDAIDMQTLQLYTLRVKAHTQYPHFQSYLGLVADSTLTQQGQIPFLFKLTPEEQLFAISAYRTLYSGPQQVESMAQLAGGSWPTIPFIMNTGHFMNSGLNMNMTLGDVENYLTYFKVGKDSHATLTAYLGSMKDPFYTSSDIEVIYDTDYYYMTLTLDEAEANAYPIKEVGIFNDQDKLAFYVKHPSIEKTSDYKVRYRFKLKVSGLLP
jgi:hypothetical protein